MRWKTNKQEDVWKKIMTSREMMATMTEIRHRNKDIELATYKALFSSDKNRKILAFLFEHMAIIDSQGMYI